MLGQARRVVGRLGREGVAHELRIEVGQMVGRLQGEAEIVEGEDVLQPLGMARMSMPR
jgi:hypothetical protein